MLKANNPITTLEIDNKEYILLDEVELNNQKYVYLINSLDPEDTVIRKYGLDNTLLGLDSEQEFDDVLTAFFQKNKTEVATD